MRDFGCLQISRILDFSPGKCVAFTPSRRRRDYYSFALPECSLLQVGPGDAPPRFGAMRTSAGQRVRDGRPPRLPAAPRGLRRRSALGASQDHHGVVCGMVVVWESGHPGGGSGHRGLRPRGRARTRRTRQREEGAHTGVIPFARDHCTSSGIGAAGREPL